MTEGDRIIRLENEVGQLRVDNAKLSSSVEHLSTAVVSLTATVRTLNDIMNQGKGAARLALALAAMAGGGIGAAIVVFLRKYGLG